MDLPSFLAGLLPALAIGFFVAVGIRRRRQRRSFPMIVNPYTFALEPEAPQQLPVERPDPPTTTSQTPAASLNEPKTDFSQPSR